MNLKENTIKLFSLFTFMIIMLGCEKVIEFDIPEADPKLVLNGYLSLDTTLIISASESVSYVSSENPQFIPTMGGVDMELFLNGEPYSQFTEEENNSGETVYKLNDYPIALGDYSLKASKSGYESVTAQTILHEKPTNVTAVGEVVSESENNAEIEITFSDKSGVANYYHILVIEENEWSNSYLVGFTTRDEVIIAGADTDVFGEGDENYFYDDALFTDDLFEGQTANLKIKLEGTPNQSNTYKVQVISCSEDYYLFHKTFKAAMYGGGPFTQPVQVYSNVENGIGVFAGFNVQEVDVVFE